MAGKEIKYSMKAREKMMKGVDTLANAVKVTLGPRRPARAGSCEALS